MKLYRSYIRSSFSVVYLLEPLVIKVRESRTIKTYIYIYGFEERESEKKNKREEKRNSMELNE